MAGIRIVCPIYMEILGGARSGLVAQWLGHWTLDQADQGRFLGGHPLYIIFFLFFIQLYNHELLCTSTMN